MPKMTISMDNRRIDGFDQPPVLSGLDADQGEFLLSYSRAASAKRQADALEAIAASLATIARHLAPVTDINAKASNWIEWSAGRLASDARLPDRIDPRRHYDIRYRDGFVRYNVDMANPSSAYHGDRTYGVTDVFWNDDGRPNDIVAYRLAPAWRPPDDRRASATPIIPEALPHEQPCRSTKSKRSRREGVGSGYV